MLRRYCMPSCRRGSSSSRRQRMVINTATAVVTGCSSGIGYETVRVLLANGYQVFGSVRSQSAAGRLASEFGPRFTPLCFDTTDVTAVLAAAEQVRKALLGRKLAALVNNAGAAAPGPLMHQAMQDVRAIMEVNFFGTLRVIQAFLPLLGGDRMLTGAPGRIVNVSSVEGKYGAPFMGAYAASKHAMEGMSDSLRRELMLYGIDVIVVGPGHVKTPVWDRVQAHDLRQFDGTEYAGPLHKFVNHMVREGKQSHEPAHIGRSILKALQATRPAVRYAIVHKRLMNWTLPLLLPARWVDVAMADTFDLKPMANRCKHD